MYSVLEVQYNAIVNMIGTGALYIVLWLALVVTNQLLVVEPYETALTSKLLVAQAHRQASITVRRCRLTSA